MNTLVVYYSRSGHNGRIAAEVAAALGADIEELRERADRSGKMGYMRAGRDAMRKRPAELEPVMHNPSDYDLVVLGGPVWAGIMCTPVRTYSLQHKDEFRTVAVFSTGAAASQARKAIDSIAQATGLSPAATLALSDKDVAGDHSKALSEFVSAIASGTQRAHDDAVGKANTE